MARPRQVFFLAAFTRDTGLTSISLGLMQALRRDRVAVGFIKPIMQPTDRGSVDLDADFARSLLEPQRAGSDALRCSRGAGARRGP